MIDDEKALLKEFINGLNFPNRLKIAFNIIRRKF
jgi:hypothetical protein